MKDTDLLVQLQEKKIEGNAVFPQSPVSLPVHSLAMAFIKNS
jgi:hypothetical protein